MTMKIENQIAGLIDVFQKLIRVAAADSSAEAVTAIVYPSIHVSILNNCSWPVVAYKN